jgi:hypothetical protein
LLLLSSIPIRQAGQDRVMKALADGADSVTIEKKETGAKYGFE